MVEPLLHKADRYIRSASILAQDGDYDSAASRLYYAMFYIAECLLEVKGLELSSHKGVISSFGLHFSKSGELDARFHQALLSAFSQRQLADYTAGSTLNAGDIELLQKQALEFLQAAQTWLATHDPSA